MEPVHFEHRDLTKFFNDHGILVYYYESYPDSVAAATGHPPMGDSAEQGVKFRIAVPTIMLRTSVNLKQTPEAFGMMLKGTAQFTIPKYILNASGGITPGAIGENAVWDKIHLGDVIVVPSRVRRAYDNRLKRGIRDILAAFHVTRLVEIRSGATIYPASSYLFNAATGAITWTGSPAPVTGQNYTAIFDEERNYRVFNMVPQDRGGAQDVLPKRVVAEQRQYHLPILAESHSQLEIA